MAEGRVMDASAVGRVLAFPGGLRGQLAALAARERPVREAARAGWARLDELRVLTAALNGSVAARGGRAARVGGVRDDGGDFAGFDGGDAGGGVAAAVGGEVGVGSMVTLPGEVSAEVARAAAPVAAGDGRTGRVGEVGFAGFDGGDASGGVAAAVGSGVGVAVGGAGGGFGGDAGVRNGVAIEGRGAAAPDALGQRGVTEFPSLARYDDVAVATRAGGAEGVAPLPAPEVDWGTEGGTAPVGGAAGGLRADVGRALRERAVGGRVGGVAPGRMAEMAEVVGWAAEGERRRGAAASGRRGAGSAEVEGGDGGLMFGGAAVAPMPQERGGDAGGVGMVVLDGRVVGQWLSERMARDAVRPGAGTTFFDPRQAPAWTPSGAV